MTTKSPVAKDKKILIVGAGVFGLSTALELTKRGYKNITVLDRYLPPVVDGSSVDISRVIRVDYADELYTRMALEAQDGWSTEYKDHFHAPGFVILADKKGHPYLDKIKQVSKEKGVSTDIFENAEGIKDVFPDVQAKLAGVQGYVNRQGGWADAEQSMRQLAMQCTLRGVSFVTGHRGRVLSLKKQGRRVVGVNVAEGDPILADQVILATGAWTNRIIEIDHASTASGQPVGFIQLTEEEADTIRHMPVIINLSTGIFVFPPYPGTNVLKVARHGYGYATALPEEGRARPVSSPKRDSNGVQNSWLPEDAEAGLREGLRALVPQFANHEWLSTRLCWYSDTPEGDFIIDHDSSIDGLFLATGGAGHAFKFLPVLGRYIADCYENKSSPEIRQQWRLRKPSATSTMLKGGDGSRGGPKLRVLSQREMSKL
ncbi:FAD dependent oxidoreductase [Sarocladium strictum]